jgi:hypothetical protein
VGTNGYAKGRLQRDEDNLTPKQEWEQASGPGGVRAGEPDGSLWKNLTAGISNPRIVCPQCQRTGSVRVKQVNQKVGISGGKATGAILTGGFSLQFTGLSRKHQVSQAHCGNCGSDWTF